jgi:signal peptidase I
MIAMSDGEERAEPSLWRRWLGSFWGQLILAVVVIGLILTFIAKPYAVPSASMEETLQPGDRVLVNRLAYRFSQPRDGDVVVFDAGQAWDGSVAAQQQRSIKSVIKEVWGLDRVRAHWAPTLW